MSAWVLFGERGLHDTTSMLSAIAHLRGALTEQQLVDYLIINCGCAAIQHRQQVLYVRFRPALIGSAALGELVYHINEQPWRQVAGALFIDERWQDVILPSDRREAVNRVVETVKEAEQRRHSAVFRRARALDSIQPGSVLQAMLEGWRQRPQLSRPYVPLDGLVDQVCRRYVWVDARARSSELVLTMVGSGFPEPVRGTLVLGLGYRLEEQADLAYGQYCLEAYGQVAQSGVPLLEDVDAMIAPPNGQKMRRRYSRLILPFRLPSGNTRLLGISLEDLSIDLRRAG